MLKQNRHEFRIRLLGHLLAPVIGLVVGYFVLCQIRPEADFLHVLAKTEETRPATDTVESDNVDGGVENHVEATNGSVAASSDGPQEVNLKRNNSSGQALSEPLENNQTRQVDIALVTKPNHEVVPDTRQEHSVNSDTRNRHLEVKDEPPRTVAEDPIALPPEKTPQPDSDALAQAEATLHETLGERSAQELLNYATTTEDLTGQFIALRKARDVAAAEGDAQTAIRAVEKIAAQFEMDAVEFKKQTLMKLSGSVDSKVQLAAMAELAFELANAATAAGDRALAERYMAATLGTARKVDDIPLVRKITLNILEIRGQVQ